MSPNVHQGKRECKLFFPEGYDEPPEQDVEEEEEGQDEEEEKDESIYEEENPSKISENVSSYTPAATGEAPEPSEPSAAEGTEGSIHTETATEDESLEV